LNNLILNHSISWSSDVLFYDIASYVHRLAGGTKPSDLPVQTPTKYQIVLNLKTAKALGLDVPPMLLARRRGDRVSRGCQPRR
jgi:ABC-type uncharacterized transport system substrate-binding protein